MELTCSFISWLGSALLAAVFIEAPTIEEVAKFSLFMKGAHLIASHSHHQSMSLTLLDIHCFHYHDSAALDLHYYSYYYV